MGKSWFGCKFKIHKVLYMSILIFFGTHIYGSFYIQISLRLFCFQITINNFIYKYTSTFYYKFFGINKLAPSTFDVDEPVRNPLKFLYWYPLEKAAVSSGPLLIGIAGNVLG